MSNPEIILDDVEVMRALFNTYSNAIGENVIDLRSVAIEKLEFEDKTGRNNKSIYYCGRI